MSTELKIPLVAISKKMVSLKSYYGQLRLKEERSKSCGASSDDVFQPPWVFYKSLHFLNDNVTPRHRVDNRAGENTSTSNATNKKAANTALNDSITESNNLIKNCITAMSSGKKKSENDGDTLFGEIVAGEMRKIKDSFKKDELNIEIQPLILRRQREMEDNSH